jgi:hypothetical protein
MSPLWSDIALAQAARAKVDDQSAVGKVHPKAERPPVRRLVRRVLHPRLGSLAL